MATAVHATLSPSSTSSPSSSITMEPRKFALAQVHGDVCLVQGELPPPLSCPFRPSEKCTPLFLLLHSVLLACTRKLSLRAQRCRGADLRARVHHHLPVLAPRRAPPFRHSDTRVARRAERAGRGRQRHRLPRTRRNGTPQPAHGPALVDWRCRRHKTAVDI